MDRRWIGILIILIVGLSAMYLIVDNSNTVVNAISVIGDVSVTLPPGYKTGATHATDFSMYNPSNENTIFVNFLEMGNHSQKYYKKNLTALKNNPDITVYDYSSNGTVHTIHYNDPNSKYKNHNETLVFFEKVNRTLSMRLVKFDSFSDQNDEIPFIMDNVKKDFKQNKANGEFKEFTV